MEIDWYYVASLPLWEHLTRILNSNFSTGFFGACFGAGFGAWAAQYMSNRANRREALLEEINSTNAAIALAFNVTHRSLALKSQHVQETVGAYRLKQTAALHYVRDMTRGNLPPDAAFNVELDLKRLDPLSVPVQRLEAVVLENTKVRGRAPQLAITLGQVVASLNDSIEQRNGLIKDFMNWQASEKDKAFRFFGLRFGDGTLDTSFGDALGGIARQTDDCVWFARQLCRDLQKYVESLREEFVSAKFRGRAPSVMKVDFSPGEAAGLVPPDTEYSDWLSMFHSTIPSSPGRHLGKTWLSCKRQRRQIANTISRLLRKRSYRVQPLLPSPQP